MNNIQYLNKIPLHGFNDLSYISDSFEKNCKVIKWDLFYESIIFKIAFSEQLKKSTEFWVKIKGFEFFIALPKMYLKKGNKKLVGKKNDKDVLIELFTLMVIRIDKGG